jgi:hypothetical protein
MRLRRLKELKPIGDKMTINGHKCIVVSKDASLGCYNSNTEFCVLSISSKPHYIGHRSNKYSSMSAECEDMPSEGCRNRMVLTCKFIEEQRGKTKDTTSEETEDKSV